MRRPVARALIVGFMCLIAVGAARSGAVAATPQYYANLDANDLTYQSTCFLTTAPATFKVDVDVTNQEVRVWKASDMNNGSWVSARIDDYASAWTTTNSNGSLSFVTSYWMARGAKASMTETQPVSILPPKINLWKYNCYINVFTDSDGTPYTHVFR